MSEISTENEDNLSVAASDFVQLNQPDEMPDQEEQQQFEFQQNPLDWTDSESTSTNNNGNDLKEMKLMIANLEAKNQMLQAKVENLELKAEICAMEENAEQKANYHVHSSKPASPPKKHMTLDAPVDQEKQPMNDLIQENQPMNDLMQNFAKTVETNYNQFKKEMERIQKHGTHNFVVSNELAGKMKELCEKTSAVNALMPNGVDIQPIRKRNQLTIKNCREIFTKDKFCVCSTSIELFGFKWYLEATTKEKGFLALFLHAIPPTDFKGNYRIEIDRRFSILNAFTGKDLIKEYGQVYTPNENNYTGWGCTEMAKFEDLLDLKKGFLTPEGDIEICADFTIKSSTLDHLT